MHRFLCALHLLAISLLLDCIAGFFAVGAELIQALLLGGLGKFYFEDSHKTIYEGLFISKLNWGSFG